MGVNSGFHILLIELWYYHWKHEAVGNRWLSKSHPDNDNGNWEDCLPQGLNSERFHFNPGPIPHIFTVFILFLIWLPNYPERENPIIVTWYSNYRHTYFNCLQWPDPRLKI